MDPSGVKNAQDEALLIEKAQSGDVRSFSALVEMYQERAIHVARSFLGNPEDAKDVAQEAFVKTYENLSSFRSNSRFYTWFYRLLINQCKDFLRKKLRRRENNDPPTLENVEASNPNPRQVMMNQELEDKIFSALDTLPFQQKSVFTLRYLEGMSLEEIAGAMDLSTGAVKAHLWQAGRKMKKFLSDYSSNRGW